MTSVVGVVLVSNVALLNGRNDIEKSDALQDSNAKWILRTD